MTYCKIRNQTLIVPSFTTSTSVGPLPSTSFPADCLNSLWDLRATGMVLPLLLLIQAGKISTGIKIGIIDSLRLNVENQHSDPHSLSVKDILESRGWPKNLHREWGDWLMSSHSLQPLVQQGSMESTLERPTRPKKNQPAYDPGRIVSQWLSTIPADKVSGWEGTGYTDAVLSASLPKRFIVYEPMVLFSPGAFADAAWKTVLGKANEDEKAALWKLIIEAVSRVQKSEVTHLAVNAGIPLHVSQAEGETAGDDAKANILRSPVQLQTLHGDFGPTTTEDPPSEEDFEKAFWVSTKQNGILQTWAPRYTMFSRGNITEKARVLGYHTSAAPKGLEHRRKPAASLRGSWAADLYAGIGYFTFSYAKLGMRVLCWEINPWSVEGLRRGAVKNGWRVRVVQGQDLGLPMAEAVGDAQIVVFIEDNRSALRRIGELRRARGALDILHINGGLLPTSSDSWEDSWSMARPSAECWLHLHENVGEDEIASRRGEIQDMFNKWAEREGSERKGLVEHVEKVKTIAPRVWHCVFDVYIKGV